MSYESEVLASWPHWKVAGFWPDLNTSRTSARDLQAQGLGCLHFELQP